jgi:hypothetical protein
MTNKQAIKKIDTTIKKAFQLGVEGDLTLKIKLNTLSYKELGERSDIILSKVSCLENVTQNESNFYNKDLQISIFFEKSDSL